MKTSQAPLWYSQNGDLEKIALRSFRKGESGAEWTVLERLPAVVLSGQAIDPVFQAVVNVIAAKIVLTGRLPERTKGRPKLFTGRINGLAVAERYLELTDAGMGSADALNTLASEFPKRGSRHFDERHIMRQVKKYKPVVAFRMGKTAKARQKWRESCRLAGQTELSGSDTEFAAELAERVLSLAAAIESTLQGRDYISELDAAVEKALAQVDLDDINGCPFNVSD